MWGLSEPPKAEVAEVVGTGVGPLEVAVEALAGAVVRALRNTGVGRGAIVNGYGPLQLIPYWPARALRAGKVPQNLA